MKPGPKPSGVKTINITLRLRQDLYDTIRAAARKAEHSTNAEVIKRLRESYGQNDQIDALADRLLAKIPNLVRLKERS